MPSKKERRARWGGGLVAGPIDEDIAELLDEIHAARRWMIHTAAGKAFLGSIARLPLPGMLQVIGAPVEPWARPWEDAEVGQHLSATCQAVLERFPADGQIPLPAALANLAAMAWNIVRTGHDEDWVRQMHDILESFELLDRGAHTLFMVATSILLGDLGEHARGDARRVLRVTTRRGPGRWEIVAEVWAAS